MGAHRDESLELLCRRIPALAAERQREVLILGAVRFVYLVIALASQRSAAHGDRPGHLSMEVGALALLLCARPLLHTYARRARPPSTAAPVIIACSTARDALLACFVAANTLYLSAAVCSEHIARRVAYLSLPVVGWIVESRVARWRASFWREAIAVLVPALEGAFAAAGLPCLAALDDRPLELPGAAVALALRTLAATVALATAQVCVTHLVEFYASTHVRGAWLRLGPVFARPPEGWKLPGGLLGVTTGDLAEPIGHRGPSPVAAAHRGGAPGGAAGGGGTAAASKGAKGERSSPSGAGHGERSGNSPVRRRGAPGGATPREALPRGTVITADGYDWLALGSRTVEAPGSLLAMSAFLLLCAPDRLPRLAIATQLTATTASVAALALWPSCLAFATLEVIASLVALAAVVRARRKALAHFLPLEGEVGPRQASTDALDAPSPSH